MRLIRRRSAPDPPAVLLRSVCHEVGPPIATLSSLVRVMSRQSCPDRRAELAELAAEYATHALSVLHEARSAVAGLSPASGPDAPLAEVVGCLGALVPDGRLRTTVTPAAAGWPVHPQHTRQILMNLVGNAVRHAGGPVQLRARVRAGRLRLRVTNGGGPYPALDRALRRPSPPADDDGLGLWVVRQLATAHGGRVRVRRARSAGLVLEVTLPRYRPRPPRATSWPRRAGRRG